jgi:RimJ/RimL family protein N-acetyltransferase
MGSRGIPTLTTERVVLRPFVPADLDELVVIHAEESFWWYPRRAAMTAEETRGFLTTVLQRYQDDGFGIEALIERATGRMIGWAGLAVPHFLPEILPAVEVGWRLSGPHRGRGLATEAGRAALEYGFTTAGLDCIVSLYEPENVASGRVMERLGFTHRVTTIGPRSEDVAVMELSRERWAQQRSYSAE